MMANNTYLGPPMQSLLQTTLIMTYDYDPGSLQDWFGETKVFRCQTGLRDMIAGRKPGSRDRCFGFFFFFVWLKKKNLLTLAPYI